MAGQGQTGWRRIVSATCNSFAGFRAAWKHEAAFRQECALAVVLIPAAFWVGRTSVEWVLLIGSVLLVLIVELLNSAVEVTVDRIGSERHTLSGRAKDLGSAAVFVALASTAMTWGLIGWQNLR